MALSAPGVQGLELDICTLFCRGFGLFLAQDYLNYVDTHVPGRSWVPGNPALQRGVEEAEDSSGEDEQCEEPASLPHKIIQFLDQVAESMVVKWNSFGFFESALVVCDVSDSMLDSKLTPVAIALFLMTPKRGAYPNPSSRPRFC